MGLLQGLWSQKRKQSIASKLFNIAKWIQEEDRLMQKYTSFRNALMLVRDLSSDTQANKHVSAALTELVSNYEPDLDDDMGPQDDISVVNGSGSLHVEDPSSLLIENAKKKRRVATEMLELMRSNFRDTITLVVETEPSIGRIVSKEVLVRTIWDSGNPENAISMRVLDDEAMRNNLIVPIPPEDKIEFIWLDGSFKYRPEFTVTIGWFLKSDMRKRTNKFYVVPVDAPFDVLMNREELAKRAQPSMLVSFNQRKSKAKRNEELLEREKKAKEAQQQAEERFGKPDTLQQHGIVKRLTALGRSPSDNSTQQTV
ncbi:hypothetical protein PG984_016589 [Apiospora sp. TS-2023a]